MIVWTYHFQIAPNVLVQIVWKVRNLALLKFSLTNILNKNA